MFSGFKTVFVGLVMAVVPTGLEYLAGVDWSFLGAKGALLAGAVVMVAMRMVTSTPIFKSN